MSSREYTNDYDNSDLQPDRTPKDVAAAYIQVEEMKQLKLYLETLKLESEMADSGLNITTIHYDASGAGVEVKIPVKKLMPKASEFEQLRRRVIARLNKTSDAELKKLFAEFETESVWELSSRITNFVIDKKRRTRVGEQFNLFSDTDADYA